MPLISNQISVTMLVVLLGLIAIIVAMRIRRSEQPKPKPSAAYAGRLQNPGIERNAAAAVAARSRRVAHHPITPLSTVMRDPSSETWGTIQAKPVDDRRNAVTRQDHRLAQTMASGDPMHKFTPPAQDLSIDHPDVVQYL